MSARDEILARVRTALSGTDRPLPEIPRDYRKDRVDNPVELFAEHLVDYKASLTRCTKKELPGAIKDALGSARKVIVPDGFDVKVPNFAGEFVRDTGQGPVELDKIDAVLTTAAVAIATTGTIVLDHGPGQGRRALTLVPDVHVCVLREDQIVSGVPEAFAKLDPNRPTTWISGPSATSDIELIRVEGVHGPRTLNVILVNG